MATHFILYLSIAFLLFASSVILAGILFESTDFFSKIFYNKISENYKIFSGLLFGVNLLLILACLFLLYYTHKDLSLLEKDNIDNNELNKYSDTLKISRYFYITMSVLFIIVYSCTIIFGRDTFTEEIPSKDKDLFYTITVINGLILFLILFSYIFFSVIVPKNKNKVIKNKKQINDKDNDKDKKIEN